MSLQSKLSQAVDQAFSALDDLAGSFTIREISSTSYNPSTGDPGNTTVLHTVTGVFDKYEDERIDGTIVQQGDLRVLVKPITAFKPSVGDVLIDNTVEYTVMNVESIRAYDTDFLWELQVRG